MIHKPQLRGAELFSLALSGALRSMGHDSRILSLYAPSSCSKLPLPGDAEILGGCESSKAEYIIGYNPSLLKGLCDGIRSFRPHVIQANGGRSLKYLAFAKNRDVEKGWAFVYRNIGMPRAWMRTALHRMFYRTMVYPKVDGIVSVSHESLRSLKESFDPRVPCEVIPRAVNMEDFSDGKMASEAGRGLNEEERGVVILFVGSLSPEKRVDRLLRAIKVALRQFPSLSLRIVGDGTMRSSLMRLADELGLQKHVAFEGSKERPQDFYHGADFLALSSDTEGLPGVILEAGACGLPVVATDVGGVRECVRDGETGFAVSRDDEEAFAERIVRLARDEKLRTEMGRRARELVESEFSLAAAAVRFLSFYSKVLDKKGIEAT